MNELSIITNPVELTPIPEFKNPALTSAARRLDEIRIDTASRVSAAVRETATLFAEIADKELYKDDGFSSVSEFGEKVFHYGKSMVSLYVNAGKVYNNDDSPAFLKTLSPFSLQEIKNIPVETVMEAVEKGDISKTPTQAALRKFAQDYKLQNSESKVLDRYYIKYYYHSSETDLSRNGPLTMESFNNYVSSFLGTPNGAQIESMTATPLEIPKLDKDGNPETDKNGNTKTSKYMRKVYINLYNNDTLTAVFAKYVKPRNSKVTVKDDTALLDKAVELLSQGLIDANVFKAMTGMSPDEAAVDPGEIE